MRIVLMVAAGVLLLASGGAAWWFFGASGGSGLGPDGSVAGDVILPELSETARAGQQQFAYFCSGCHGENAAGTGQGPPLIHKIYEPSHHGDVAIALAAKTGVRAHHWRFGNMPAIEGITDAKIRVITRFIREVQVANGIE